MSIQFVLGAAGSGKTEYVLDTLIRESMAHDTLNYFYVVPEQFTMEAQRDIVTRHPRHGTMNIDAIGLNRLAYRVFDELSVNPGQVLEDFGKSMLIKKILMEQREEFLVYGSYMNKLGFVDEMKSMMSELFQYAVDRSDIDHAMELMDKESPTYKKLHDVRLIYEKFEEHNSQDSYIVAEQLTELLADNLDRSKILADSHLYFDGFTGFTPVQMNLIRKMMGHVRSITFVFDIAPDQINLARPKEYELFRLTKETMTALCKAAQEEHVDILENVVMCSCEVPYRFKTNPEMAELERDLFRYPHGKRNGITENIQLISVDRAKDEAMFTASKIRDLVRNHGYRYKDIAVVAGDLSDVAVYYRQAMDEYRIPVFIDENASLAGDPCSDTVRAFLAVMSDNFSFDSVFRLLKSGMTDVDLDDMERMENYALKRNLRGLKGWQKEITDEKDPDYAADMNSIRSQILDIFGQEYIDVFRPTSPASKNTVRAYTESLYHFLMKLGVWDKLEKRKEMLYGEERFDEGDAYGQIFDKMITLMDKMVTILGDEKLTVREYAGILDAGITDMKIGIVPPTVDRVVVGDMTRSRLNHVKVVFFTGVNEGIIPKPAKKGKILSGADRQRLEDCGVTLAPSDRTNAYTEQFYIYTIMTKPSDQLYIVYRKMSEDFRESKPSYLVDRVRGVFPDIVVQDYDADSQIPETVGSALKYVINQSEKDDSDGTWKLVSRMLLDMGCDRQIDAIAAGRSFTNSAMKLPADVVKMIYGDNLALSVSRLERYAECQFKYFLTYGLGLAERETYQINAANVGNILHSTMEKVFNYVKTFRENDWVHIDDDELMKKTVEFADSSAADEAQAFFEDSSRSGYMRELLADIAVRTTRTLRTFIMCGEMQPDNFERRFNTAKDGIDDYVFELSNGLTMSLNGVIDRIDEYSGDEGAYFRIVDYKSSDKTIDIDKVLGGLQMQLVTYGAIAYELEKRRLGKNGDADSRVHVGGLLYYTFNDPVADVTGLGDKVRYNEQESGFETEESVQFGNVVVDVFERALLSESRYSGIVSDSQKTVSVMDRNMATVKSAQRLQETLIMDLMEANRRNIERLGGGISKGQIDINPVRQGDVNACKYCGFKGVCAFDDKYSGNRYSRIYSGEQDVYHKRSDEIEQISKDMKSLDDDIKKAQKKYDGARKKYDTAKKKVDDRGDKATQKMRDDMELAAGKLAEAESVLGDIESRTEELKLRAAQLGMEIKTESDGEKQTAEDAGKER